MSTLPNTWTASCSQCGAPLEASSAHAPITCSYCGAQNHLSYDFAKDSLIFVKNQVDFIRMREDLEKRMEILVSNLSSIDPVSRWTEGGPLMSPASFIPALILAVLGIVVVFFSKSGYIFLVIGIGLAIYRINQHFGMFQIYERDRIVSSKNAALVSKLRSELADYSLVRGQLKIGGG